MRRARKDLSDLGGTVTKGLIGLGAVGPALGGVAGALSAVGAGVASIAGAVGPAVGVLAAVPVALGAVAQGAGVAKFALDGISDAVDRIRRAGDDPKKLKEAVNGLTPAAAELATTFAGLDGPIDRLRRSAQAGLFPGLNQTMQTVIRVSPRLRDEFRATGDAVGDLAAQAADLGVKRLPLIQRAAGANIPILRLAGAAGLALADAALQVYVAAQPMTTQLAAAAVGAAEFVRDATIAGRKSGELASFFERAYATASQLGRIVRDLGVGLFNALSIGAASGRDLLASLEEGAARFREWTESASGVQQIAAWFAEGSDNLSAMGRLVRSVSHAFSGLGDGSALAPLLDQIGGQLVPVLANLVANAQSSGALSGLVTVLANLGQALVSVTENGSSLASFVAALGLFSQSLLWLVQNVPGASQALGALFVILGAAKAASLLGLSGVITALGGALAALGATALIAAANYVAAMLGITTANISTAGSAALFLARVAAQTVILGVQTAATWLATAATTAFGAALAFVTSPIGAVVLAIGLLVAAVVLLWKNNETFRDVVTAAWKTVQAGVGAVVDWITGTAVPAMRAAWGAVSGGAAALGGAVAAAWNAIRSAVTAGVNAARAVIQSVWGAIGPLITGYVNVWRSIISTAWSAIQAAVSAAVAGVRGAIAGLSAVVAVVAGAFNAARAAAASALAGLVAVVRGIPAQITSILSGLAGTMAGIGANIVAGLANGIRAGIGAVMDAARSLANAIPGPIRKVLGIASPSKVARKIGQYVIDGLVSGLQRGKATVADTVTKLAKLLRDNLSGSAESKAIKQLNSQAKGLREAGRALDQASDRVATAREKLADAVDARNDYASGITSSLRDAASAINALDNATDDAPASVGSVTAYLQSQLASLRSFSANLQSLTSRGLSNDLIGQIADAGLGRGSQLASLLAAADQQSLGTLNQLQGQINAVSKSIGSSTANTLFSAEIGRLDDTLQEQLLAQKVANQHLDSLAERIGESVERSLRAGGVKVQVAV